MACISMGLHPNHVIYGLFCRQEAELQIISPLLSMILTYTCAVLNAMKNNKTLQQFCGSLYEAILGLSSLQLSHSDSLFMSSRPSHTINLPACFWDDNVGFHKAMLQSICPCHLSGNGQTQYIF